MAAVAPAAPPGVLTSADFFERLPGEVKNVVWAFVHEDAKMVVHHFMRLNAHRSRGPRNRLSWKMPRGYVSVDPFHLTINSTEFRSNNDAPLIGIPCSMGMYFHKIRLPNGVHGARGSMTHATVRDQPQYKPRSTTQARSSIYVNLYRDVFYFSNAFRDVVLGAVPPHRLGHFQWLSDNLLHEVRTHHQKLVPPGALSWMGRIRKLAVELEDGVDSDESMNWFSNWALHDVFPLIPLFTSLRRLYLVLNVRDPACQLPLQLERNTIEGRDGFIRWSEFLDSHRAEEFNGPLTCGCRVPRYEGQPVNLGARYNFHLNHDGFMRGNLMASVAHARQFSPHRLPQEIFWVVDHM